MRLNPAIMAAPRRGRTEPVSRMAYPSSHPSDRESPSDKASGHSPPSATLLGRR